MVLFLNLVRFVSFGDGRRGRDSSGGRAECPPVYPDTSFWSVTAIAGTRHVCTSFRSTCIVLASSERPCDTFEEAITLGFGVLLVLVLVCGFWCRVVRFFFF